MPEIVFHHADGRSDEVRVPPGTNIMRAALTHGVHGIVGECGGQAMCATCHIYVRPQFRSLLPAMSEDENDMLEAADAPRTEDSRLGCQIVLDERIGLIEVDVPEG